MKRWKVYEISRYKNRCITWDKTILETETAEEAIAIQRERTKYYTVGGNIFYKRYHAIPEGWEVPIRIRYRQLELNL